MEKARAAGIVYLVTFVAGTIALVNRGSLGAGAGVIAAGSYVIVTWLLYAIFKPVNRPVSLAAAIVSVAGIAAGVLRLGINPLVFFGVYCLLIGVLCWRSTFVPRAVGMLLLFAGCGWLTFASPPLARFLYPYNLAPGLIGEGALTLWLLFGNRDHRSTTAIRNLARA